MSHSKSNLSFPMFDCCKLHGMVSGGVHSAIRFLTELLLPGADSGISVDGCTSKHGRVFEKLLILHVTCGHC